MRTDREQPVAPESTSAGKRRRKTPRAFWVAVAAAGVLILAVPLVLPSLGRARERDPLRTCVNNLRQIDGAKQQWALEHHKSGGDVPELSDIAPYLVRGRSSASYIVCPSGGSGVTFDSCYEIGGVTNPPKCKISADFPVPHVLELKR